MLEPNGRAHPWPRAGGRRPLSVVFRWSGQSNLHLGDKPELSGRRPDAGAECQPASPPLGLGLSVRAPDSGMSVVWEMPRPCRNRRPLPYRHLGYGLRRLQGREKGQEVNHQEYGIYYDDLAKIDGHWKFTDRLYVPMYNG